MKQFEALTKYIPLIKKDSVGTWRIDRENDGTLEHPIQPPFVIYSEMIRDFVGEIYALVDQRPEWELNHYGRILEDNGLLWGRTSMSGSIVEDLDARCVCALLVAAVRAERFCDGALLGFFEDGSITRWLQRLKEIDDAHASPLKKIQILSDGLTYGPCPAPDEEVDQRLTILRDGRIWFTGYNFGIRGGGAQGRKLQFKIPQEDAEKLFTVFDKFFSGDPHMMFACDAGSWDAILTDEEGKVFKYRGSMTGGCEVDGIDLSNLTREILPIEDLWAFCRAYTED